MIKKAGCILINIKKKEIALVCRKGKYSFPKGQLEENETLQECAIRETLEETEHECELIDNKEIAILSYKDLKGQDVEGHFYIAIDKGKTSKIIEDNKKEQTKWIKIQDVEKTLSHKNLIEFWKDIKNKVEEVIQ